MAEQAIVDSVLNTAIEKIGEEVGSLLGEDVRFSKHETRPISKEEFFALPREKSVLTKMQVSGDQSGEAYVVSSLKDSVLLGGTLIMLPYDQIRDNIKKGVLDGEEADAFGEVANIIAGAYTQTFLELSPQKLRFVRSEIKSFIPTNVDVSSSDPFPPGEYYLSSCSMSMKSRDLGQFEVLFPMGLLGLSKQEEKPDGQEKTRESFDLSSTTKEESFGTAKESPSEKTRDVTQDSAENCEKATGWGITQKPERKEERSSIDAKVADRALLAAMQKAEEEVGDFLGQEIRCSGHSARPVTKKEFFSIPRDYSVVTRMEVSGDASGESYIVVDLKGAITLGSTLILLPPDQIAKRLRKAVLEGEEEDAFGEIANILAGVYTQTFLDLYPQKLHFKKTNLETILPTKVDISSVDPFPPKDYYLSSCSMSLDGQNLGQLEALFPLELLGIDQTQEQKDRVEEPSKEKNSAKSPPKEREKSSAAEVDSAASVAESGEHAVIAIMTEDINQAEIFSEILAGQGYECRCLTFQDNFKETLQGQNIRGVFLVMNEVGEQGFAATIKARSALKPDQPLVVAGPQWTRTTVLKAVKYGACDILVTPAEPEEILQKVKINMAKTLPAGH